VLSRECDVGAWVLRLVYGGGGSGGGGGRRDGVSWVGRVRWGQGVGVLGRGGGGRGWMGVRDMVCVE
jgi:hypothetical protein